jgi:beta-lactam-binding protein with PASTA domain
MGGHQAEAEVPPLVGLPTEDAHNRALDARLLAVDQDPLHKSSTPGTVTAQAPPAGCRMPVGQRILIWVDDPSDGGGGGGGGRPLPVDPEPLLAAGAK